MKTLFLPLCIGAFLLICYGGCNSEKNRVAITDSAPVVLTFCWDKSTRSGGYPEMSISGKLMTSSSAVVSEPVEVSMLSGTIDNVPGNGFVLCRGDAGNQSIFKVLAVISDKDGKPEVVLDGKSSVEWCFIVKGRTDIVIKDNIGKVSKSHAVFSAGPFRIRLCPGPVK